MNSKLLTLFKGASETKLTVQSVPTEVPVVFVTVTLPAKVPDQPSVIVAEIARDFRKGSHEWNDSEFSDRFLVPHRLVLDIIHHLVLAGVLNRVEDKQAYMPSRDLGSLTLKDVETAFDGEEDVASLTKLAECPEYSRIIEVYRKLIANNAEKSDQVTFADLSAGDPL